jgi:hypothetical protein
MFLDFTHRPVFILKKKKHRPVYVSEHNVSESESGDRIRSPKRCVLKHKQDLFLDKDRMMDDVRKHNISDIRTWKKTFISRHILHQL